MDKKDDCFGRIFNIIYGAERAHATFIRASVIPVVKCDGWGTVIWPCFASQILPRLLTIIERDINSRVYQNIPHVRVVVCPVAPSTEKSQIKVHQNGFRKRKKNPPKHWGRPDPKLLRLLEQLWAPTAHLLFPPTLDDWTKIKAEEIIITCVIKGNCVFQLSSFK